MDIERGRKRRIEEKGERGGGNNEEAKQYILVGFLK